MSTTPSKFWAGGFLFNPKNKTILLHKRDGNTKINPNKWAFFGGLNEGGETPKQCFSREIKEELDFSVSEENIKTLCDYLNEELKTYRYVFYVESDIEKESLHLNEGAGFDWIPIDDVSSYDLTEKTKLDIDTFLKRKV